MTKTHTIYDAMPFPAYAYREYPKHLHPEGPDGPFVEVADEDQELAALAEAEGRAPRRLSRAQALEMSAGAED